MERDFIQMFSMRDYHTAGSFLGQEKYHGFRPIISRRWKYIHNLSFRGQFSDGMLWELFGVGYEHARLELSAGTTAPQLDEGGHSMQRLPLAMPIRTAEFGAVWIRFFGWSRQAGWYCQWYRLNIYNPETDEIAGLPL